MTASDIRTEKNANSQHSFLKKNGLLLALVILTVITLLGQIYTGWQEFNSELQEKSLPLLSLGQYLASGHFIQSTFENWESEFLQMGLYVFMTIFLFQQGSAESKSLDEPEDVDREPKAHKDAPWPVKRGGIVLKIYQNSLTLAFAILFCMSFALHAYGTMKGINATQDDKVFYWEVFFNNRFWFESLQNWQSEFLSVAAIIYLSIFLRQKGSPESKPVDAPHSQTGK